MTLIRGPRGTMCTIRSAETGDSVRVSVYFDGTGNNRQNVRRGYALRARHESTGTETYSGSYAADYSNVSRLEQQQDAHEGYDYSFKLYVEGIGTRNLGYDSPLGTATGDDGVTCVTTKVDSGIRHLLESLESEVVSRRISYLHLDAFGFSRGAAAARYFVYKMMRQSGHTLLDRLRDRGFTVGSVAVKFVGLFDTVAAFGTVHHNDTRDLELDAITAADYVVQLAAGDEHRENFRLTNINSAKNQNKGLEIFLPGVHSDVGGGYLDGMSEVDFQIYDHDSIGWNSAVQTQSLAFERDWLSQMGWYELSEIGAPTMGNEIYVNRTGISNKYTFIPMHLMARYATQYGCNYPTLDLRSGSDYGTTTTPARYRVPGRLNHAKQELETYIDTIAAVGTGSSVDWINNDAAWLQLVRHRYFHFSSGYGTDNVGRNPQWQRLTTAAGLGKTFPFMRSTALMLKVDPSLVTDASQTDGYRLRIVQDG
jgi:Uncharacterized alpha/beta hydrolase domain (DUF2235)